MTTAEATIQMIRGLSESELLDVQSYVKRIVKSRKVELKRYSKKELLGLIDESIGQGKRGEVHSWAEIQKEAHELYGI